MANAVHRLVEHRAATRPDAIAIVEDGSATTYRELNQRANTMARRLCESGLTRRARAIVRVPRSTDLAVVLLAVLKAGACYTWVEPGGPEDEVIPGTACIVRGQDGAEQEYLAIDLDRALIESRSRPGPNLPVLTRGSDVACVLSDASGHPQVLVPHETVTALPRPSTPRRMWDGEAGALDLWIGLMSGATLSIGETSEATAA